MEAYIGDHFFCEKRGKPRTDCCYPAVIRGRDAEGGWVEVEGQVLNLSASGMYVRSDRCFDLGANLSITVQLSESSMAEANARLIAQSLVVRSAVDRLGGFGIGVKINRFRFH